VTIACLEVPEDAGNQTLRHMQTNTTDQFQVEHTQSSAILFYADAAAPGRILPRHGDSARIRALETFFYFTTDVIALSGAAFSLSGPEFSDAAAALTERYLSAIAASERFLIDNEFIGGASFSIADIAAFTIISAVNRHLVWNQLPRLAAWHDRIGRRPAVQTGIAAFDDKRDTVN
jgi:GST-like protein